MDPIQIELQREFASNIAELRAELQRQHDEILFLRSRTVRPKPSLPEPEKFNGQIYKYDTWLPSIKAKLRVDGNAIGDSIAQFYYVFLNLESQAQAMVLPQLSQAEDSNSWNYMTILDQLTRVYDNPNKVQEAEDRLHSVKQGTDSLASYVAKFERVLYEARGQNWPDVNKISIFRNGLSTTMRSRLAQQLNLPRKYSDFVRVVQQLSGRSLAPVQPAQALVHTSVHAPANNTPRHGEPMEIGYIGAMTFTQSSTNSQPPSPTYSQHARSTSPGLREQYRLQGRCVRCGSYDHWVDDCLLQPFRKQTGKRTMPDRDPEGTESEWED